MLLYTIFPQLPSAAVTSCNVNKECQFGFVCISGNAQSVDENTSITLEGGFLEGECVPTVPMREACYFYEILTGKLGRAIVVLVLISLGISWSIGKLEMKQLLTVFLGVVLFFGSFQIVKYLMGRNDIGYCNLIDYSQPVGMPSYALIERKLNQ